MRSKEDQGMDVELKKYSKDDLIIMLMSARASLEFLKKAIEPIYGLYLKEINNGKYKNDNVNITAVVSFVVSEYNNMRSREGML